MRSPWTLACGAMLLATLAVLLLTFRDYGVSWDERQQADYGLRLLRFYATGGLDDSHARLLDNHLYGGFFSVLEGAAVHLFGTRLGEAETTHLVTALFGWTGMLAAAVLAARLRGARTGFLAALFLTLMPTWYGHLFNNTKDIPFGVMYAWSLAAMLAAAGRQPRPSWSAALGTGIVVGLTMGIRIGGIVLLAYMAAVWLARAVLERRRASGAFPVPLALAQAAGAGAVAYATMLAVWPWAAASPLDHPLEALHRTSAFRHLDEVLYRGMLHLTTDLPWDYLPGWLLIQTPEVMLPAIVVGTIAATAVVVQALRGRRDGAEAIGAGLVLTAVAVPLILFVVRRPVVYDAARHFLFLLPPLAVLAAVGVDAVCARLRPRAQAAIAAVLAAGLALPVAAMLAQHPYQYIYFNAIVGGLRGAERRYELDYWSHSFREATLGLRAQVALGNEPADTPRRIFVCGSRPAAAYYFPPQWRITGRRDEADFAIVLRRHGCNQAFRNRRALITVQRRGVPLAYVYDQRARLRKMASR